MAEYKSGQGAAVRISSVAVAVSVTFLTLVLFLGCFHFPVEAAQPEQEFTCTEVPKEECDALVALFNQTGGSTSWINRNGWLDPNIPSPCDGWYGVECYDTKFVQRIDLRNNNLIGSIPATITNLSQLVWLDLRVNKLGGPLPSELYKMTNLGYLNVATNTLTGKIPVQLDALDALYFLYLANNQLEGEVPNTLCALGVNRSNLDLSYNKFSVTGYEIPTCLREKDPDWAATQTVPPTGITAKPLSSHAVRLDWTPITYQPAGGYYSITASPLTPFSPVIIRTTTDLGQSRYDFSGLTPDLDYRFTIHSYKNGDYRSEESESIIARPTSMLVRVVDETGQQLGGVQILHYRNGQVLPSLQSFTDTLTFADTLQVGDALVALAEQYSSAPADQAGRAYRVYLTNVVVEPCTDINSDECKVQLYTIDQAREHVLTVTKENTLVLFDLVVSVEWETYRTADQNPISFDTFLKQLARGLRSASEFLYEVTDGQFAFGKISIYDGGRHWADADLQILVSNQVRPSAVVGGISAPGGFTLTTPTRQITETVYYPGFLRMGRAWNRYAGSAGPLDGQDAFRTLVHEFAHYAFYLYDEYFYLAPDGTLRDSHCVSATNRTTFDDPASMNASIMDWHYNASEFAWRGENSPLWSDNCLNTQQWQMHGKSDWETILQVYSDKQTPARWRLTTPGDRNGQPNPGPSTMPFHFPAITVVPPANNEIVAGHDKIVLDVTNQKGERLPTQSVQIYLVKPGGNQTVRLMDQGTPNSVGQLEVLGAQEGDTLKAINWDGSLFTSHVIKPNAPVMLTPAIWTPSVDGQPIVGNSAANTNPGLILTVTVPNATYPALTATLVAVGNQYSVTRQLLPAVNQPGAYTGLFTFDAENPVLEAHLWIRTTGQDGRLLETVTTYAIGGAPSSYGRAYPPVDPASSDGNLRLHIPDGALQADTVVIVMPTRGISLTQGLSMVSMPYTIRASGNITGTGEYTASLTLFYSQQATANLDRNLLRIYRWNEERSLWESQGGELHPTGNFISAPIKRFGIYAILSTEGDGGCNCPDPLTCSTGCNPSSLYKVYLPSTRQ